LACVVQPARNSLRKFLSLFLLRFIGQFYQFVKIMNLKCIQYFCTIFQSLEYKFFLYRILFMRFYGFVTLFSQKSF
jgi:hypothetical protein